MTTTTTTTVFKYVNNPSTKKLMQFSDKQEKYCLCFYIRVQSL